MALGGGGGASALKTRFVGGSCLRGPGAPARGDRGSCPGGGRGALQGRWGGSSLHGWGPPAWGSGEPRSGVVSNRGAPSGGGFGLWACLPDPKRALGAHGVPRIGEARLRRTALTPEPCGARAGYTPPSADVLVLASAWGSGHGTCKEQKVGRDSLLEAFLCR